MWSRVMASACWWRLNFFALMGRTNMLWSNIKIVVSWAIGDSPCIDRWPAIDELEVIRNNWTSITQFPWNSVSCILGRTFVTQDIIYVLLSQWMPEYPSGHVQRYPVDPWTTHDPLFRHGEDEQLSSENI